MLRQFELVDRVLSYEPQANEALLNRAYVFAMQAHGEQKRASGDPYYSHPIEVAGILTDLRLDTPSIITGLLHDTLEDTETTYTQIQNFFGEEVADLVSGVTKLSQFEMNKGETKQAENFRKLLLATSHDIRVLLVKLADRLHNMRTLHFIKNEDKRRRIAQETMDIYAPLAGRMGMQNFRDEFEDLAFKVLNSDARDLIMHRLDEVYLQSTTLLDNIKLELENVFAQAALTTQIDGRVKRPFSIWRKMQHNSISFEQLSDIYGFRLICATEDDCYRILGLLHRHYRYVPGRYKDYISTPKLNNYRALHTTIIGPHGQRIEMQIKTRHMHHIAETGVAAHWLYKEKVHDLRPDFNTIQPFTWLRDMIEQLKAGDNAEEFLENTKLELFIDQVFCFTPKGRLIALPRGALVLDFAYAVHTQIGHSCIGAYINGTRVSLRTALRNGDEIEIIRGETQRPKKVWLAIVQTGKARAAIRHFFRVYEMQGHVELGKQLVTGYFTSQGEKDIKPLLERVLGGLNYSEIDELYAAVGRGDHMASEIYMRAFPKTEAKGVLARTFYALRLRRKRAAKRTRFVVGVGCDLSEMSMRFADNCFPLPGDPIVGILYVDQGMVIYPADAAALDAFEEHSDIWVDLRWDNFDENETRLFTTRIIMTLVNQTGALNSVTQTISDFNANISNLTLTQRDDDFYNLVFDLEVMNREHVMQLLAALKGSSVVTMVKRVIADKVSR